MLRNNQLPVGCSKSQLDKAVRGATIVNQAMMVPIKKNIGERRRFGLLVETDGFDVTVAIDHLFSRSSPDTQKFSRCSTFSQSAVASSAAFHQRGGIGRPPGQRQSPSMAGMNECAIERGLSGGRWAGRRGILPASPTLV
jgi:hypothetical protein